MRRFVATEDDRHGLQILTEGLHEYTCDSEGTVDAVQGAGPRPVGTPEIGLAVEPAAVVLSAVKTAEDSDGVVVRVFNSGDEPVTTQLHPRFRVGTACRCDLEERYLEELVVEPGGRIRFPLAGGQVATVRLTTLDEEGEHR
jgi:mannosylglycerate hydrolase